MSDGKDQHIKELQHLLRDERERHERTKLERDALRQALFDVADKAQCLASQDLAFRRAVSS